MDSTNSNVSGLDFVDSFSRPSVRAFLEKYGNKTCFLNGMEVQSVTHERCRRLLLTGTAEPDGDDWPSQIAGADNSYLLPHLVISGPAYTSSFTTAVTRVGESGQLSPLLDGSVLTTSMPSANPFSSSTQAAIEALASRRREAAGALAGQGRAAIFAGALERVEAQRQALAGIPDLDLGIGVDGIVTPVSERVQPGLTCLELGLSRCAIVQHGGLNSLGWDNHSDIEMQAFNFENLFADLGVILDDMANRTGPEGGPLSEEVVTVVISEMGRAPVINGSGGKDHWTFTSAMLIGPGVAGGRVIGGFDDAFIGRRIDLASGDLTDSGVLLSTENLGASLLAMAGVDPGNSAPISALYTG